MAKTFAMLVKMLRQAARQIPPNRRHLKHNLRNDVVRYLAAWANNVPIPHSLQMSEQILSQHPILLFDGVCNVCNGFIAFIIRQDPGARFRFASLQSEAGQKLLKVSGLPVNQGTLNTVVLIYQGKGYVKSEAALRVLRLLKAPWPFAGLVLSVFPQPLRDRLYDLVARNRYRWFGRKETCMVPVPELRQRFLSSSGS